MHENTRNEGERIGITTLPRSCPRVSWCPRRNSNLAPSEYKAAAVPLTRVCSVHSSFVANLPFIEGGKPYSRVHQFHVGCLSDLALCVSYGSLQVMFPFQIYFINLYVSSLLPHDCRQCIRNVCCHYTKMENYVNCTMSFLQLTFLIVPYPSQNCTLKEL
jgi:hypothetical protein